MDLFFHHVGQIGAKKDFPKTVFSKHAITDLISNGILRDNNLIEQLKNKFSDGKFNCWGVPAGAASVIRNLKEEDYVLLVESSRIDGMIPALCPVKVFWRHELRELSEYLWGDSKFPFIFFFNTIQLDLPWIEFIDNLGYKENFSPRGNFYKISSIRLAKAGGAATYVHNILGRYSNSRREGIPLNAAFDDTTDYNLLDLQLEEENILDLTQREPVLVDSSISKRLVKLPKRDQAFRKLVKQYYNYQCAVCGQNLKSPDGLPAVHAAHIFPKEKLGSDDLRNGICLCFLHHWAFDTGWFSINDDHRIIIRKGIPKNKEYENIFKWENGRINLPKNKKIWPHSVFLNASRRIHGF